MEIKILLIAERIRYLTLTDASKVWMPDTFFRNEKIGAFHNILTPNLYIRVYPDGDVLYSIRYCTASQLKDCVSLLRLHFTVLNALETLD